MAYQNLKPAVAQKMTAQSKKRPRWRPVSLCSDVLGELATQGISLIEECDFGHIEDVESKPKSKAAQRVKYKEALRAKKLRRRAAAAKVDSLEKPEIAIQTRDRNEVESDDGGLEDGKEELEDHIGESTDTSPQGSTTPPITLESAVLEASSDSAFISEGVGDQTRNDEDNATVIEEAPAHLSATARRLQSALDWVDNALTPDLKKKMAAWCSVEPELPAPILQNLSEASFLKPTTIQKCSLHEAIGLRKDIIGAAETGSGKTLAYGIPMVSNILRSYTQRAKQREETAEKLRMRGRPVGEVQDADLLFLEAIVIVPSRELAAQVTAHLSRITTNTPVQAITVVGGMSQQKQLRLLDKGKPQIVVGTPGRLWSMMEKPPAEDHDAALANETTEVSSHLSDITRLSYLALDEADRLTEEGHFREVKAILEKVVKGVKRRELLQTFVFSATLALRDVAADRKNTKKGKAKKAAPLSSKVAGLPLGRLSEQLQALFRLINLRTTQLHIVDLTTNSPAKPVEEEAKKAEGTTSGVNSTRKVKGESSEAKVSSTKDLKLPANLSLTMLRCLDGDREAQLFMFLSRYFSTLPKAGSKVLVFTNTISYVYRMEPLLQLLLGGATLKLKSQRKRQSSKNAQQTNSKDQSSDDGNRDALKGQTSQTNSNVSVGVDLLRQFFSRPAGGSTVSTEEVVSDDQDSDGSAATSDGEDEADLGQTEIKQRRKPRRAADGKHVVVVGIHSQLKQSQRLKRMEKFQRPETNAVLVCTDVAARGLDLPAVNVVVHFQPPRTASLFVHRSGRTARAEREGECVCICGANDARQWATLLRAIDRQSADLPAPDAMADVTSRHVTAMKETYKLACEVEAAEHQEKRKRKDAAWLSRAAREIDVICDDLAEETDDEMVSIQTAEAQISAKRLESKKRQLLEMLKAVPK